MMNIRKLTALTALVLSLSVSSSAFADSTGQYIDDATITTKVKTALLADAQLKALHISVLTNHGTVQLSGSVNTADDESQAVETAQNIDGVKEVKDMMIVKGRAQSDN
jgi:osmotically-inducible protein OsmY